jgi:2-haloacid dehalogenase
VARISRSCWKPIEPGAYPEVAGVLSALRTRGATTSILTNGDPDMIADAVSAAGIGALLDHVLTVSEAGIYKPHAAVYRLASDRLSAPPHEISFQSRTVGRRQAQAFGPDRINRAGAPTNTPTCRRGAWCARYRLT